jgi:hypothetical protein
MNVQYYDLRSEFAHELDRLTEVGAFCHELNFSIISEETDDCLPYASNTLITEMVYNTSL